MSDKTETWKYTCFANDCFRKSDVINIIGLKEHLDNKEALFRTFEIYGIELKKNFNQQQKATKQIKKVEVSPEKEITRIKEDIKRATENLWYAEDYLRSRGISLTTAVKINCGCIIEWYHPKVMEQFNGKPPFEASPRLITPVDEESYFARDIRADKEIPLKDRQYIKQKAGESHILNLKAILKAKRPIVVVEGEIDLLSLLEIGYEEVIALGSTSMVEHLIPEIQGKNMEVTQPFIISLDNDKAGQAAAEKLVDILQELNYEAYNINISGECKDVNEAIISDRQTFEKTVLETSLNPKEEYLNQMRVGESNKGKMNKYVEIMRNTRKPISTGFERLDVNLDGGLYAPGLYIIAGGTSVGKTALMQQMAYNIAKNKRDIMYYSLEMSEQDLFYRDISRLSYKYGKGQSVHEIITNQGKYITEKLLKEYETAAEHMFTHSALSEITVEYVEETAKNHVKKLQEKPILFVDYLQILEPTNPRGTEKQIVDHSIKSLNILSRTLEIPIVVAASLNRTGYSEEISFQALKESGALEYTGDIVIGLQFQAMAKIALESKNLAERTRKITEERNKPIRKMEAVVLKHRNGKIGSKTYFDYIPKYNLYKEGLPDQESLLYSAQMSLLQGDNIIDTDKPIENSQKKIRTID